MDKDSILPIINGNGLTTLSSKIKANNPPRLTNNQQLAYFYIATAKNSSQDWKPDLYRANSRLALRGFFCVRVIIMMDCVGGGLIASVISPPFSLYNGISNPLTQTVTIRLETNRQSPQCTRRQIMSNKTVSGIPSSVQHSSEHSLIFCKNIAKTILPFYGIQSGLIDDQYDLLSKLIGLCEVFKSLVTANVDGDVIEIRPSALLGLIDSILAQANAIHVVHDELVEQLSNRNKEVK